MEDIQVRATTICTHDNRRAVVPNTALFTDKVLVNTAFDERRLSVRVGVGNGGDIAEAKRVVEAAARGAEGVLADPPPRALVAELGGPPGGLGPAGGRASPASRADAE